MRKIILQELKNIETAFDVKILYACESGSRVWGFPSKDSDYDVRFIYIHKPAWYLSIDQKRDVIELPINDQLDISGWELTKALRLFRKSNPPLIEWLSSGIEYYRAYDLFEKMVALKNSIYSPKASIHHYLAMAKGNYREFLQGEQVKSKKYFYVLRPILASLWIEKHHTVPPLLFQTLVSELIDDELLKAEINQLLERKIAGAELSIEPKIIRINQFIETELTRLETYAKTIPTTKDDPTEKLDLLFQETLVEIWQLTL